MATPVSHIDRTSKQPIKANRKVYLDKPKPPAQEAISCGHPMLARKNWKIPTQPSKKNTIAVRFMVRRVTPINSFQNGRPLKNTP